MKETNEEKKLKQISQGTYAPTREFLQKGERDFITAYAHQRRGVPASHAGVGVTLRGLAYVCACAVFMFAVSAYADKIDVGPTSPLYSLKKLHEQMQVLIATPEQKDTLRSSLVERRLHEISKATSDAQKEDIAEEVTAQLRTSLEKAAPAEKREVIKEESAGIPVAPSGSPEQGASLRKMVAPEEQQAPQPMMLKTQEKESLATTTSATPIFEMRAQKKVSTSSEIIESSPACNSYKKVKESEDEALHAIIEKDSKLRELYEEKCK